MDTEVISDHIVFFIHGMGQQTEKYGRISTHVETMQRNTEEMLASHYAGQNIRVKFIPVEWHSKVHALIDERMNRSTLRTVPKVRMVANEWAADALYYFTKPYGQSIIDSCCQQMTAGYDEHVAEYPEFSTTGSVHVIGFSLGGLCAYDILSEQWGPEDGVPPWEEEIPTELGIPPARRLEVEVPKLKFKVKTLFTCGSPIAATLVIRGLDFYTLRPPPRTALFNIFHPFDPLGYRLEPMIDSDFYDVQPVQIERLARRRILPVPLPRIPNLGIKSSIGAAAPLIWQARRTFFRYIMTGEGRLIVDSGVTQRTVVEPERVEDGHAGDDEDGEEDSDTLEVRSDDGRRKDLEGEFGSRSYESLPESRDADGVLRRHKKRGSISARRASRGRIPSALRRKSGEIVVARSDDSLGEEDAWVGDKAKVLYEEEEEHVWASEVPEATTWSRRWMGGTAAPTTPPQQEKRKSYWYGGWSRKKSNVRVVDGANTDGGNDAEVEEFEDDVSMEENEAEAVAWDITDMVGQQRSNDANGFGEIMDESKQVVDEQPQRRSTILGMAGSVASAALSVIGLSHSNSSETTLNRSGYSVVPQPSTSSPAALGRKQKPRRSKLSQEKKHGQSDSEVAATTTASASASTTSLANPAVSPTVSVHSDPSPPASTATLVAEPESIDDPAVIVTPSTPSALELEHPLDRDALSSSENADAVSLADSESSYATATGIDAQQDMEEFEAPASPDSGRTVVATGSESPRSDDEISVASGGAVGVNAVGVVLEGKDGKIYPRIDYVLTEGVVDAYASEWIVALKSHFRYWANKDMNLHMLKAMVGNPTSVVKV